MSKVLIKTYRDLVVYPIKLGVILTNKKGKAVNKAILSDEEEYDENEIIFGSVAKGYVNISDNKEEPPIKCIFIVLNPFGYTSKFECPTSAHIVAHEAVHVKNLLFEELYIKPDTNNDEPEAYLVGSIVKLALEMIEELKEHEDYKKGIKV